MSGDGKASCCIPRGCWGEAKAIGHKSEARSASTSKCPPAYTAYVYALIRVAQLALWERLFEDLQPSLPAHGRSHDPACWRCLSSYRHRLWETCAYTADLICAEKSRLYACLDITTLRVLAMPLAAHKSAHPGTTSRHHIHQKDRLPLQPVRACSSLRNLSVHRPRSCPVEVRRRPHQVLHGATLKTAFSGDL